MNMLPLYLTQLQLLTVKEVYQQESLLCMKSGDSYETYLYRLCEQEVQQRMSKKIQSLIKKAQFPCLKTLEHFDFTRVSTLDKQKVMTLMEGEFTTRSENILALGNSGTGKTHLAIALGLAFCQKGETVYFQTAAHLVHQLIEAHESKKLLNLKKKLQSYKILIVDELGYVPFSKTGAELLFEILASRYEQQSTIITSNLPFEEWPQVFGCQRLTGALLDRLTHHAHILPMNGESYRLINMKSD